MVNHQADASVDRIREVRRRLVQDLLNGIEPDPRALDPTADIEDNRQFSSPILQKLYTTVEQFGARSTIHGLQHIFHSRELTRRIFWLVLMLVALCLGLAHMHATAMEFLSNPLTSQLKLMSEQVKFPDITLCNLKPASESMSLAPEFRQYIRDKWGYFDNWYVEERKRRRHESKVNFYERARLVFGRLFQILWVSGDSRDIGVLDVTLLLDCSYNSMKCHQKNFSLRQNYRFWNCYTFFVHKDNLVTGKGGKGAELDLVLFTDNHNTVRLEDLDGSARQKNLSTGIYKRSRQTEEQEPISLKELLNEATGLNHLLTEGSYEPGGFRVFIHERKLYPMLSREFVDVQSGTKSIIKLRPLQHSLLSSAAHQCTPRSAAENVSYVRYFAHGSKHIGHKKYQKTDSDFVAEEKQNLVHENCGCYSHRYPFTVDNSELCYYVPPSSWKIPPEQVLRKIRCHDRWILDAEKRTYELMQKFHSKRFCEFTLYRPLEQSSSWPRFEHVQDIWTDFIAPKIASGKEFTMECGHNHHIFNRTETAAFNRSTSRQELVYYPLLLTDQLCLEQFCNGTDTSCDLNLLRRLYPTATNCLQKAVMTKNMALIGIHLLSSAADSYVESVSYEWTEALSETGGILGLWLGISLLSVLEIFEFFYVLARNCFDQRLALRNRDA
ncbi:hypothetical protein BOX15_Mlig013241g3 [Macrostomum lignano]|uniref:Uncharacterized protein n=1 Tax=Macrostomum lignano TaxID=282301 RepID=A0A267DP78_9PLAT|nr:hypothetical protein BOX15_Mlig013241g3 [Macrostomum lignano]